MSNSSGSSGLNNQTGIPLPSVSPLEGESSTEIIHGTEATEKEINDAAKEGRISIRSSDLAPKMIESLAKKFGPDVVVGKIAECMEATKTMAVGGRPFSTPDYKIRLDAVKLLLQYQVGMPVARSESVVHNVDTMQSLDSKLQKSPALRRAVGRMLKNAEDEDGASSVIDVSSSEETEDERNEAEAALQSLPEVPETPVEAQIMKTTMGKHLMAKGNGSFDAKYSS